MNDIAMRAAEAPRIVTTNKFHDSNAIDRSQTSRKRLTH